MKSLILLVASLCVLNAGYIKEALNAKDDHNKLAQIYEDACDKEKKASGCYNLAVLYSRGDGNVKKDEAKATKLYEQACIYAYEKGCNNYAIMLAEGKGVKEDVEKAREIFTKSCKNGLKEACENLEILGKN